jgi:hypothetical protein
MNNNETLEQEAPIKTIKPAPPKTPKTNPAKKTVDLPEPSKNELKKPKEQSKLEMLKDAIDWVDLKSIKVSKSKEEPLHCMVYYKIMHYPAKKVKHGLKPTQQNQRHGRITFSHFLSRTYPLAKKYKFGTLNGKVIFQVTDKDGLTAKLASTKYPKHCVSNADIAEIIFDKYGLNESSNSVYFKLKDLGNDFYLIDEIIK